MPAERPITGNGLNSLLMDPLPLSLLNDLLYCPRRAGLKLVEGWRQANVHTERGDIVHDHADLPGFEISKGVKLLRALPVWSDKLGLNGKCDIVEQRADGTLHPVEFKLGRRKQWENDDAQVCAQALCLEEMFGCVVPNGSIFHADSKRRRVVEFTSALRDTTLAAIETLRQMEHGPVPPPEFRPACEECTLFDQCLPKLSANRRVSQAARSLFDGGA